MNGTRRYYPRPEDLVSALAQRGGFHLTESDLALLASDAPVTRPEETARTGEIMSGCFRGYFDAATDGDTYAEPTRIPERYGRTLEQNYPEASQTFLRFAYTYWTFHLLVSDFGESHPSCVATYVLREIENPIRARFFPTPGPIQIDPKQREHDQRLVLASLAPQIDVEEFMAGNPILIRDRQAASRGCLGMFLL